MIVLLSETYLKFAELKALSYMSITDSKISNITAFRLGRVAQLVRAERS